MTWKEADYQQEKYLPHSLIQISLIKLCVQKKERLEKGPILWKSMHTDSVLVESSNTPRPLYF